MGLVGWRLCTMWRMWSMSVSQCIWGSMYVWGHELEITHKMVDGDNNIEYADTLDCPSKESDPAWLTKMVGRSVRPVSVRPFWTNLKSQDCVCTIMITLPDPSSSYPEISARVQQNLRHKPHIDTNNFSPQIAPSAFSLPSPHIHNASSPHMYSNLGRH